MRGVQIVRAADIQERDPRVNRPAIEVTIGPDVKGVPPAVVRMLGDADLGIPNVTRRPRDHYVVLAV
ncbi:hypothetical protein [Halosolutus gelatinilyticus]|uniref:hypothetical protein n=1 Tax=Halosolutus gelatinilyticus TaxID=2931975 RepID=UPI001FF608E9|nr:hypothetical protein [Halosolutus gelatinilyticus]